MNPPNITRPIAPEYFWRQFSTKLHSDWINASMVVCEYYNHAGPWTTYMTAIVQGLAEDFDCVSKTEFWPKIDICYFSAYKTDWDEWALEAAIEIENNVNWTSEICKLLMVNSGLKVLIAYEDNPKVIQVQLERFTAIYNSRRYNTNLCSWLFIFGPRLIPSSQDFVAYKFDGANITDITGDSVTIQQPKILLHETEAKNASEQARVLPSS